MENVGLPFFMPMLVKVIASNVNMFSGTEAGRIACMGAAVDVW